MSFYLASTTRTRRDAPYITFWRPEHKGYAWPLVWAGKYSLADVETNLDYLHNGGTFAVPYDIVEALGVAPTAGMVDADTGPVVPNTRANWKALMAAIPFPTTGPIVPDYKGARHNRPTHQTHHLAD